MEYDFLSRGFTHLSRADVDMLVPNPHGRRSCGGLTSPGHLYNPFNFPQKISRHRLLNPRGPLSFSTRRSLPHRRYWPYSTRRICLRTPILVIMDSRLVKTQINLRIVSSPLVLLGLLFSTELRLP